MNKIVRTGLELALAGAILSIPGCNEPDSLDAITIQAENDELKAQNNELNSRLKELSYGLTTHLPLKDCPFESRLYYVSDHTDSSKIYTGVFLVLPKYYVQTLSSKYTRIRITFADDTSKDPLVINLENAERNRNFPPIITNLDGRISDVHIKLDGLTRDGHGENIYTGPLNAEILNENNSKKPSGFSY